MKNVQKLSIDQALFDFDANDEFDFSSWSNLKNLSVDAEINPFKFRIPKGCCLLGFDPHEGIRFVDVL